MHGQGQGGRLGYSSRCITIRYSKLSDSPARHRIMGYDHSGDRLVDVGKPESLEIAETLFK